MPCAKKQRPPPIARPDLPQIHFPHAPNRRVFSVLAVLANLPPTRQPGPTSWPTGATNSGFHSAVSCFRGNPKWRCSMRRPRPESPPPELLRPLVLAAHALWLDRLKREGWRLGDLYDEDLKITPYLMPFDQLPAYEQAH